VQHLKSAQDIQVLKGTMETANTVFLKYRSLPRSEQLLKEIKYTVETFQETHLAVYKAALQQVIGGGLGTVDPTTHFEFLKATIHAFFSLNTVDLPEFFEDHREEYFTGFLKLLEFHHPAVASTTDAPGLLEDVKGVVCDCFALYTEKYQEEFTPYLVPCVQAVWTLLTNLDLSERYDQLIAKGIHFLASAARTHWPQSPFQDPQVLSGICSKVVFPNIFLRDSDVEMFQDNCLDFVRRDMEGADQETRRRSAIDLVKSMGQLNEAKVTEIIIGYVKELLGQAQQQAGQAERFKDACLNLCIAMAVKGQTRAEGVTVTNQNVNVMDFFSGLVVPELQDDAIDQRPVLRATCLKFVTVFRNQLQREQVLGILPLICKHIRAPSPVVHTYAAICIDKLLTVRDRTPQGVSMLRYEPEALKASLLSVVDPILQTIASGQGIPQNEYMMRTVQRIFTFLKQTAVETGLATLKPLSAILIAVSANPLNPVFNHNLFEAVASIVKVSVAQHPDVVEAAILPALSQILERNVSDFLPYTFQILGLLLDATTSVKPLYQELFARLMAIDLWKAVANIPGLVRLLKAYFGKHQFFGDLLKGHMQAILERFQFCLSNRKTEASAFELLMAMFGKLPLEFYQQSLQMLMTVILTKLQTRGSPKCQKDFVIAMSLFIHRTQATTFIALLNAIQAGMFQNLLNGIWTPVMRMQLRLDDRKICALGLAKLMQCDDIRQNPQSLLACSQGLISLLGLLPSAGASMVEEGSDDEAAPADGGAGLDYEVSFNKLKNTDLPGASNGHAPEVPDMHVAVKALVQPLLPSIGQLAQSSPDLQPLALFLQ